MMTGCALAPTPVGSGFLFTDVKGPVAVDDNNTGYVKKGEACATNVLGLVATGDASIETAKKVAGISNVSSISSDQFSILGLFSKYCTVVTGE
jgi:hypothetical protein